jgi:hypothetical protein
MTASQTERPYRLVDHLMVGWHQQGGTEKYGSDDVSLDDMTLDEITERRGPWRPVILRPDDDSAELVRVLTAAGRKALITLAVALHDVALADMDAHRSERGRGSALTAGRGGSWESQTLRGFAWQFGFEVSPKRVDEPAAETMREILGRWTGDPAGYVELAENLAAILAEVADARPAGTGNMGGMADQWIMKHDGAEQIRNWVLSLSQVHGPLTWY